MASDTLPVTSLFSCKMNAWMMLAAALGSEKLQGHRKTKETHILKLIL
jgi:hypothetical protein